MQASWDRRGPNWFPASLAALTPQALDYTRLVFGLGPDDPVPISRREGDPLGTYRTGTLTCAFEIICQLIVLCIFAPLHLNLQLNDVLQTRPHDCHLPLNVDTHHTVTHAALITFEQPANVGSRQRVTVAGGAHLSDRLKIHIDFLDERTFDSFTQETFERTGFPGQWLFDVDELEDPHTKRKYVRFVVPHELQHLLKCQVNHAVDKCKCDKPLLHIGKDESIYSQNVTSSQEWTHWGVTTLGKKVRRGRSHALGFHLYGSWVRASPHSCRTSACEQLASGKEFRAVGRDAWDRVVPIRQRRFENGVLEL